ncbi:hypothetical protein DPEC_G00107150 [Dallia pectoralis]|uniref:Uncharacterized protein n=1 Tax=Dallia pectoralis TaxID=75939 RepID=A0ACC2GSJ4_DALPE|nr:hypothetical protein DPEC_G00107150 [Dallia pectoralis]
MRKVLTNWKMSTCKDDVVIKPNKSVAQLDPLPLVSSTTQPTGRKRKVTVPDGDNAHKKGKPGMSISTSKCQLQAKSPNRPEGDFRVKTLEEILKEKAARMSASGLGASDVRGPGNAPDSSKGVYSSEGADTRANPRKRKRWQPCAEREPNYVQKRIKLSRVPGRHGCDASVGTTTFNVEASSKDSTDQFRTRLSGPEVFCSTQNGPVVAMATVMSAVPQSCVTTPCTATADLLPLELEFIGYYNEFGTEVKESYEQYLQDINELLNI